MTCKTQIAVSFCLLYACIPLVSQQSLSEYTFEQSDLSVSLVDIDDDEDMDAFLGANSEIYFLENVGDGLYMDKTEVWKDRLPEVAWDDISIDFADIDGDGDFDLSILGNEISHRVLYMNEGSAGDPVFKKMNNSPLEDMDLSSLDGSESVGYTDAVHSWADMDNDGDMDCIVGGKQGWFLYYENIGDAEELILVPLLDEANPLDKFRVDGGDEGTGMQYESSPYLIDVDVDGDYDLFSGNQMGTFHFYENIGTPEEPIFEERFDRYNPLDEISVKEDSKVAINDYDCDGTWEAYYSGEGEHSVKVEALNRYLVRPIKAIVETDELSVDDEALELTGGYPQGGTWSGTGVRDGKFFPSEVGSGLHRITYTVTTFYGCNLSADEIINVKPVETQNPNLPSGVKVLTKYNSLSILNSDNIELHLRVMDPSGRIIMHQLLNDSRELPLDTNESGLYIVNVSTSETLYSEKILIVN